MPKRQFHNLPSTQLPKGGNRMVRGWDVLTFSFELRDKIWQNLILGVLRLAVKDRFVSSLDYLRLCLFFIFIFFLFSPLPIDEYIVRWSRVWTKCVCVCLCAFDFLHILQRCDIFAICLRLCFPENRVCSTGNSISIWLQLPELFLLGISELLYNRNHKGNKNSTQGQVNLTGRLATLFLPLPIGRQ